MLVTFRDTTGIRPASAHRYHDYDRPWGEVGQGANRRLTDASYRRRDFLRLLAGGYDMGGHPESFVGTDVRVGGGNDDERELLPEVFGSVRAYFDSVSNGAFHLHVRLVNPPAEGEDEDGLPRWIELPETKEHYSESTDRDEFWSAAYQATLDSLSLLDPAWNTGISLPDHTDANYPLSRLLRRKILFLHSGVVFNHPDGTGRLHPRVDWVTIINRRGMPILVGYRYVMGERQGFGENENHNVDRFAGIGMHAHEIGHLLGLTHGWGYWADPTNSNQYDRTASAYVNSRGANQLGWTLMQGGGDQGPEDDDGRYWLAYRSCPNPINPFYLMDLGWLTPDEIRGPHDDYAIAPGTTHWIERNTTQGPVEFLLNRRTLQPFDGRYVSFYDYATGNDAEQGLMIWRRYSEHHPDWEERPMLIVADERRYRNARDRDWNPDVHEYHDMLSDPFAAGEIADRRYNHTGSTQADVSEVTSLNAGEGLRQGIDHSTRRNGTHVGANPDPGDVNLALTNIRYDGDNILVDVTFAPPTAPDLTAHVQDGQVTLRWPLPLDPDPTVTYQYQYAEASRPIVLEPLIALDPPYANSIEVPITDLTNNTPYTFEVTAVNGLGTETTTLTATPQELGASAVDFNEDVTPTEDDTPAVATYTVTGLGATPTWGLDDDTENIFELQGTGPTRTLHFRQPPNFETIFATREDTVYTMTLRAHADPVTVTQAVAVTVRNVEEAGGVSLSSLAPEQGQELTAEVADVDGVLPETTAWTWEADGHSVHTDSGGETSRYTPSLSDVGRRLQVRVSYVDGHGPNKSAESASTAAVIGPELVGPDAPTFVEHGTFVEDGEAVVPTYMVSGVDGPVTWSLDGTDEEAFDLAAASSQASLSFSSPPNYEEPTDTDLGGTNTYHVTVVATLTDGAAETENSLADMMAAFAALSDDSPSAQASSSTLTKAVVVTVEDGDDPGAVDLPVRPPGQCRGRHVCALSIISLRSASLEVGRAECAPFFVLPKEANLAAEAEL